MRHLPCGDLVTGMLPQPWIIYTFDPWVLQQKFGDHLCVFGVRAHAPRKRGRSSDKAAYVSPTRGAQGNALKTVLAIPYVLNSDQATTVSIEAQGSSTLSQWPQTISPAGRRSSIR